MPVDPERAVVAGWMDELSDADALIEHSIARAKLLGQLPRDAYAKSKTILRERELQQQKAAK